MSIHVKRFRDEDGSIRVPEHRQGRVRGWKAPPEGMDMAGGVVGGIGGIPREVRGRAGFEFMVLGRSFPLFQAGWCPAGSAGLSGTHTGRPGRQ